MRKNFFMHPSSYIDEPVAIGKGTKIWHFCHISKNAKIGEDCLLGQNVFIGENVKIGNNVKIQNNVSVYEGVTIEDNVFIGPSAVFTNVLWPRCEYPARRKYAKTLIKKGATIGANATVVCGNIVGSYAFVGAGSVVTRDVLDYELCFGVSIKHCGWVCVCGNKLAPKAKAAVCKHCGRKITIT